jgi:hypothetical protein
MPYRTSDLCHAKSAGRVLPCPTASRNFAILQVFYETCGDSMSTVYAPVPAQLQYATLRLEVLTDTWNSTSLGIPARKSRDAL